MSAHEKTLRDTYNEQHAARSQAAFRELLGFGMEYPLHAARDGVAWVAALLTLAFRGEFEGLSPFFLFEGPGDGCTPGVLASETVQLALGVPARVLCVDEAAMTPELVNAVYDECLQAVLLEGCSGFGERFEFALFGSAWRHQALGRLQRQALPAHTVWLAAGRSPMGLTPDLARRTLRIALNSDRHWTLPKSGSERYATMEESRAHCLARVATLVRSWRLAGAPLAATAESPWCGMEQWQAFVGSVLRFAGVSSQLLLPATLTCAVLPVEPVSA